MAQKIEIQTPTKVLSFDENITTGRKLQDEYVILNRKQKYIVAQKMLDMGFNKQTIVEYLFPDIKNIVFEIEKENENPRDAFVEAAKNCKIEFKNGKNGSIFDKNMFYNAFFDNFVCQNKFVATFESKPFLRTIGDIKPFFRKASEFTTDFSFSGESRKNNIILATNSINGKIIKSGEIFSFNEATGLRSQENGYQSAKIIVSGKYVDGFGGGVCQVSTTLYNAALLCDGLEIIESHSHSLPSHYVEPGFDAMVNTGSSDLKIKNNSDHDFLLTADTSGGVCRVVIYGEKPTFVAKRRYEKYEILQSNGDVVQTEYVDGLDQEYSKRMSYAVDGYKVKTYLDFYDGENLVKTKFLRDAKYNPKDGLIVEYKSAV